jgi:hypothetical protein
MSYWQMDDKFLGHHKTIRALRAGAEALQMWVALRSYVAHNETDGDIPNEDIDDLPGAPKHPRKWLKVLVDCGKPTPEGRGAGLVDPTVTGWKMHNYEKRGMTRQQIDLARENAKKRKENWKERQAGTHAERRSEHVPNDTGTSPRVRVPAGALPSSPIPSHPTEGEESAREPVSETKLRPPKPLSSSERQALALRPAHADDVAVLEAWRDRFKKEGVFFTAERAVAIAERRNEDMTHQDALDALEGAAADEWFIAQGAKVELVFAKRARFEAYRDAGRAIRTGAPLKRPKGAPAPRQPHSGYSPSAHAKEIT